MRHNESSANINTSYKGSTDDMIRSGQLALSLEMNPQRTVHWLNARLLETKRLVFKSKQKIDIHMKGHGYSPTSTDMAASDIPKLSDPTLRYALRFQDAARAVGRLPEDSPSKSGHNVSVIATDKGFESTLLNATYSGMNNRQGDTFIDNLYTAAPNDITTML